MTDDSQTAAVAAGDEDHWPSFEITPKAYEEAVAAIAGSMSLELVDWQVKHLDPVEGWTAPTSWTSQRASSWPA